MTLPKPLALVISYLPTIVVVGGLAVAAFVFVLRAAWNSWQSHGLTKAIDACIVEQVTGVGVDPDTGDSDGTSGTDVAKRGPTYLEQWCIVRERDGKTGPYNVSGYSR
jgi:hypothetical protein